ncbi:MAG: DUF3575 domain-containing protein [Cytophagaceae bacterium]|nr:DUF3575 domain-containing protein [Cytophagaceae bacterium]
MKKLLFSLIVFGFLFPQSKTNAQVGTKTLVKFNLSGIAIKNYTLQFERVLTPHSSITLSAGVSPNAPLPFRQALLDQYADNEDGKRAIETTLFTKYIGTIEYRFYFAGRAPSGWYIAPFARYLNIDISQDYTYTPSDGILHKARLNAKFDAYGGGILLGRQWMLGKHVGLDLWLLGPFIGTNIGAEFVGEDPLWRTLKPADVVKLKSDIEGTQLPGYTTTATLAFPLITAKLDGPYYGVRAFGLALSYGF